MNSFLPDALTASQAQFDAQEASSNRPPPASRYNLRFKPTFVRVPRRSRGDELSEGEYDAEASAFA